MQAKTGDAKTVQEAYDEQVRNASPSQQDGGQETHLVQYPSIPYAASLMETALLCSCLYGFAP